jgi:predicted enzyme related to lactoylglutathione lyase
MPRPIHFEFPAEDAKRATKFFSDVFGWQFQEWEGSGYHLATTGKDAQGIDGAIMQRRDPKQPVVTIIDVDSIDGYAKKIESNGGQMVVSKMAVGDMGFSAYFKDTEGNIHGLWETAPKK